jgi:hypothetical protein
MARPKITQPVTDNKERAQKENQRRDFAPDEGHGSPSRAHPSKHGGSEKKPGKAAPKQGR